MQKFENMDLIAALIIQKIDSIFTGFRRGSPVTGHNAISIKKEGYIMNVNECITTRRSIRKYKPDPVDHSLIESIVSMASYSPSWKNTQITRYIAIDDSSILKKIADDCTPVYNSNIIQQSPMLIAVTFIKGRCGFERDGSYSTKKEDRWQMFDTGAACQTFCLEEWNCAEIREQK